MLRLYFIYFTITGVKKIIRYAQDFVIQRLLYQGFTVLITYPCEGGTVSRLLPPTCIPVNKVTGKQSVKKINT